MRRYTGNAAIHEIYLFSWKEIFPHPVKISSLQFRYILIYCPQDRGVFLDDQKSTPDGTSVARSENTRVQSVRQLSDRRSRDIAGSQVSVFVCVRRRICDDFTYDFNRYRGILAYRRRSELLVSCNIVINFSSQFFFFY